MEVARQNRKLNCQIAHGGHCLRPKTFCTQHSLPFFRPKFSCILFFPSLSLPLSLHLSLSLSPADSQNNGVRTGCFVKCKYSRDFDCPCIQCSCFTCHSHLYQFLFLFFGLLQNRNSQVFRSFHFYSGCRWCEMCEGYK